MQLFYAVNLIFVIAQAEVTLKFQGNLDIGQSGNLFKGLQRGPKHTNPTPRAVYQLVSQQEGLLNTPIYETEESAMVEFPANESEVFPEKRRVKDDAQFRKFIVHVYKQHLKVFQKIKDKVTPEVRKDVEDLTTTFRAKFIEFVNSTQNFNIKTRLGGHKVVMNTINTSNNIMKRLLDTLLDTLREKGALRIDGYDMVGLIKKQIIQEKESEIQHACTKLGICLKDDGFSQFVSDVIVETLRSSDAKIIQMRDAITEVFKEQDFSDMMDTDTLTQFKSEIKNWELSEPNHIKSVMIILKNIIHNKYTPITVPTSFRVKPKAIYRTVGILELLDSLDEALPSTEKNKEKFEDIKSLMKQWSKGERKDIQEIMRSFVKIVKNGFENSDRKTAHAIRSSLNDVLL